MRRDPEKEIQVWLADQDLTEEPAFVASLNWCRLKRDIGLGKFVNNSKGFKLSVHVTVRRILSSPAPDVRGASCRVNEALMSKFVDGDFVAVQIVRAWRFQTARRRHQSSLRRIHQEQSCGR